MAEREAVDARAERRIVEATVVLTAVAFWRSANDPTTIVKQTLLVLGALGVTLVGLRRVLATARVRSSRSSTTIALVAFVVVAAVAVITSDATWRSLQGSYGRSTGFLTYGAAALLFAAVVRSVTEGTAARVARAAVAASGLVAAYGLLQWVGLDPYDWALYGEGAAISTMGNTNFVSGYLGTTLPLTVWAAVAWPGRLRWVGAAVAVGTAACIVATRSEQGLIAAFAGLALFAMVIVHERAGAAARRSLVAAILAVSLLAGVLLALGFGGSGPLAGINDTGFAFRRHYWSAAVEMGTDDPLTGVGFDRWGAHYREVRPLDAAPTLADTTDEPHSVPLNMFAGGGVPLALAYGAFAVVVGLQLLRGLARTTGDRRLLLGGVGGAWVGYHLQSAVSIDVPALPALHFVLAGLIVVLAGAPAFREVVVPPLVHRVERQVSKKRVEMRERPRLAEWQATAIVVVLGILGLWQLTRPVRADIAVASARAAVAAGDSATAADRFRSAFHTWGREAEYYSLAGEAFGRNQEALVAQRFFERAVAIEPRRFSDTLNAARAAVVNDDDAAATRWYASAARLEPRSTEILLEYGRHLLDVGEDAEALPVLERANELTPSAGGWYYVAFARDQLDDPGADEAWGRAVELLTDSDVRLRVQMARVAASTDRLEMARTLVDEALEIDQSNPEALLLAGSIAESDGRTDDALGYYERVLQVHPTAYPAASEGLARLRSGAQQVTQP